MPNGSTIPRHSGSVEIPGCGDVTPESEIVVGIFTACGTRRASVCTVCVPAALPWIRILSLRCSADAWAIPANAKIRMINAHMLGKSSLQLCRFPLDAPRPLKWIQTCRISQDGRFQQRLELPREH